MHRHLQKLLLITLITFCGQAQGAALERRIERPLTEEDDREEKIRHKQLFCAVWNQDIATVETLIADHVNVNALSTGVGIKDGNRGFTPLHLVPRQGSVPITIAVAQALIDAGADVNAQDDDGVTPLENAINKSDMNLVKMLIAAGAHIDVQDESNSNEIAPLYVAVSHGINYNNTSMAEYLIIAGASVNAMSHIGLGLRQTALHMAAKNNGVAMVELLLRNGADRDLLNINNETAADIALAASHSEELSTLSRLAAKIIHAMLTNPAAVAPEVELCIAIRSNSSKILKDTIDTLAFPVNNPITKDGDTLLHYAATHGFIGQALLLISYGADPGQKNTAGVRAIDAGSAKFRRTLATGTERSHLALTALERPGSTHTSVLPRAITEQIFAFAGDLNPLPETLIAGISGIKIDEVMALRPGSRVATALDAHKRAAAKSERRAQAEERADAADRRQRRRLADGSAEASPRHANGCTGANGCPGCGHE